MDAAYDHIQEEAYPKYPKEEGGAGSSIPGDTKGDATPTQSQEQQHNPTLTEDLQEAYKRVSSSAWGARLGGFLGSVVKQGENVYKEAGKEFNTISGEATRGLTSLQNTIINRTRSLSLQGQASSSAHPNTEKKEAGDDKAMTPTRADVPPENTMFSKFKMEAAKRLKAIQEAEDAADEALLKFGTNVRDFLQNAITIAPPAEGSEGGSSKFLFESKDAQGKRVIHASRFDAQLHVIHTSTDSFAKDPESDEFAVWSEEFDAEKKTKDISDDLAKYPELRTTMEQLVPDKIPYADFWRRYYFLRHSIETAEARRRDLLKAASAEDEVGWGDDSDSDEDAVAKTEPKDKRPGSTGSSTTIHPPPAPAATLNPKETRKSNDEKSQADSDASYDVVGARSGVPSQAPSSPKDLRKDDDSDDEWE